MFLIMYPFLTREPETFSLYRKDEKSFCRTGQTSSILPPVGWTSFVTGRHLDRRKLMAAGAAVYLAVLATCGCLLLSSAGPRGRLSPTEIDFVIAVAVSANLYALFSMTRLSKIFLGGAGAAVGESGASIIAGDGERADVQNGMRP